jgi:hypothetical protein
MDPRDFLHVADELATGATQAEWRSAVSRAYYGAFHVARLLFRQCSFVVPQGDQARAYLWLRLANAGHPDVQQAGADLNYLRRIRNWADYDLDRPFPQALALAQVPAAVALIRLLDQLSTTPTVLAGVTAAIRTYERDVLGVVTWQP